MSDHLASPPELQTGNWFARAQQVTPGGVHSPVRAFASVGCAPIAITRAKGARLFDTSGRAFVDCIGAWGPALLGHAQPDIARAVTEAVTHGLIFGLASPREVELVERIVAWVPGCEMVRLAVSGTEATMSAVRIARAATGRAVVVKCAGGYHGHADAFLVSAGSGAATLGVPDSPGVAPAVARDTAVARFNDLDSIDRCFAEAPGQIAAVIVEPVVGNMGCVPPEPGFLEGLRERCTRHGAILIFDEVMTGFRVARGGAAERYGVTPDLVTMAKILGGGMPLAAFGGRADLMRRVAPAGPVYQAGTYAAHPVSVAAGLAMLDAIAATPGLYETLERRGDRLEVGLRVAAAIVGVPVSIQRVGSMFTVFFSATPVRSWDDAAVVDRAAFGRFFRAMLQRGVLLPPSPFEAAFLSLAHDDAVIDAIVTAAAAAFSEARV